MKKNTIKDIAKECNVSITTVSRVINNVDGFCSKETQKKIVDYVKKINYQPNPAARSLVTRKTNLIGVILPDIYNHFFQEYFKGAEDYLGEKGYKLILCNTEGQLQKENEFLLSLSNNIVDGIMITTGNNGDDNSTIIDLWNKSFPIVIAERYGEGIEEIPSVIFDNIGAVEKAVEHLFNHGHTNILFFKGPSQSYNASLRYEGFIQGMKKCGLKIIDNLICEGDYKFNLAYEAMKKKLDDNDFSAILCANDLMAIGVCKAIHERKKTVPDDFSVVGLDGTNYGKHFHPQLCSMAINGYEMGKVCAKNLLNIITRKKIAEKQKVFKGDLIIGESVKKIN